jgi:uncharacterized protein DUF7019
MDCRLSSRTSKTCGVSLLRRKRRSPPGGGRTYLYVSDAKVDMLTDGRGPSLLDHIDPKVRVGVQGVAEAELGRREIQAGRYARAERVCAALAKAGRLGTIDENTPFFRVQMLAAWGFWNRYDEGYADVMFFHGFVNEHTFVGVGGSAYHSMERASDRMQQHSNSGIQTLMDFLRERSRHAGPYVRQPPGAWPSEAWEADHDNPAVPESLEFVAERYLDDTERGIRTIIGSPIYVARTGQPVTRSSLREYERLRNEYAVRVLGKPRGQALGKPSWPRPAPLEEPRPTEADAT